MFEKCSENNYAIQLVVNNALFTWQDWDIDWKIRKNKISSHFQLVLNDLRSVYELQNHAPKL